MSTEIKKRGKQPSDKLISLINDAIDKGNELHSIINQVWEQGAEEGFSKEEIRDIVRPMAKQKGLNKDQVYYLTHKPEMLEKSKNQYRELIDNNRNIPTIEKPDMNVNIDEVLNRRDIHESQPQPMPIQVEDWQLDDVDNYDREFLIKIIHYLYRKLEPKKLISVEGHEVKTKAKAKAKTKPKSKSKSKGVK